MFGLYFFIYFLGVLCHFQECFTYRTAASIFLRVNQAEPSGNPWPSAGCWETFIFIINALNMLQVRTNQRQLGTITLTHSSITVTLTHVLDHGSVCSQPGGQGACAVLGVIKPTNVLPNNILESLQSQPHCESLPRIPKHCGLHYGTWKKQYEGRCLLNDHESYLKGETVHFSNLVVSSSIIYQTTYKDAQWQYIWILLVI